MNSPVILVTGAGKGIGKSTVIEILRRKAGIFTQPRLVLTSRTQSDLEELQKLCHSERVECAILALEFSTSPTRSVEFAIEKFGQLDMVIHCAGVGRFGDFLELKAEDLHFVMKTNVEASFLFMQAAYSEMKEKSAGDIVWVTSVAAEQPFEQSAIYCMSKYAQKGLIEVMRLYARKDGIRIIDVRPGATLTPMWGCRDNHD
jgi:sepiapterin reductase